MKKFFIHLFILLLAANIFSSCSPRIEMDMAQWGDHALIDNVKFFNLKAENHNLQEYYTNGQVTPARQRVYVSIGNAVIDAKAYTATIPITAGIDLAKIGIELYHQGTKIEPVNNAPIAGIIGNFTAKQFVYRVYSADGTIHDWTIKIQ